MAVIVAALNEEPWIASAVRSAMAAGADEVIVADGGSTDGTRARAAAAGAHVLEAPPMRARQFNAGAATASASNLVFLHADTTLPADAAAAVCAALAGGADFGGFRLRFAEPGVTLRIAERLINARTQLTRCPWGDQAQFITRARFVADGGFREIPLMEDYEMAVRMKRAGHPVLLPLAVTTSGRRFIEKGALATVATNWRIVAAYRMGTPPEKLAEMYRGTSGQRSGVRGQETQ